jgi:hypothetical protein
MTVLFWTDTVRVPEKVATVPLDSGMLPETSKMVCAAVRLGKATTMQQK